MSQPSCTVYACPRCQGVARHDQVKFDNPVVHGEAGPVRPRMRVTRCPHCSQLYWLADAKRLAEVPLAEVGLATADVVVVEAGPQRGLVMEAIATGARWRAGEDGPVSVTTAPPCTVARGVSLD